MKSTQELLRRIESLKAETPMLLSGDTKEIKASNRLRSKNLKEIDFLNTLIKYLESGASEEFVKKEATRVGGILETHRVRMESHINTTDPKLISYWKKEYETEHGLGKLKTQYKTLEYLLS